MRFVAVLPKLILNMGHKRYDLSKARMFIEAPSMGAAVDYAREIDPHAVTCRTFPSDPDRVDVDLTACGAVRTDDR